MARNDLNSMSMILSMNHSPVEPVAECSTAYDNLTSRNVINAVRKCKIKTNKYILLYLYDPKDEQISSRFLMRYGAGLNNRIKTDMPMFTVYDKAAFEEWSSNLTEPVRSELAKQYENSYDPKPRYELMKKLAADYGVDKCLPALVVIDSSGRDEMFTYTSLRYCSSPDMIYKKISDVLNTIDMYPNDFDAVISVCSGVCHNNPKKLYENYGTADMDRQHEFLRRCIFKIDHSIGVCAQSIGVSRNTLNDFLLGKKYLKRENIYALAFHLRLEPEEMNWLVLDHSTANDETKVHIRSGRDRQHSKIEELLLRDVEEYEVNEMLMNDGFEPIASLNKET